MKYIQTNYQRLKSDVINNMGRLCLQIKLNQEQIDQYLPKTVNEADIEQGSNLPYIQYRNYIKGILAVEGTNLSEKTIQVFTKIMLEDTVGVRVALFSELLIE